MKKENNNTMQPNLSDMVKNTPAETPIVFSEDDLDTQKAPVEEPQAEQQDTSIINIVRLNQWFDANVANFPNIRKPTVTITGVDPNEQLLLTVPSPTEEDQNKKRMIVLDDAHIIPVLDQPAMDMQIYKNHTFRIVYDLGNGIFIKSYGVRTGLVSVFCNDINDQLIPYGIVRAKKKDETIEIITRDASEVIQKLSEALDFEALQLRYKQSSKAEGLETNQDAVTWLLERQEPIQDINHHLQIDNVIIDTLT
jgi:hypothetical protein